MLSRPFLPSRGIGCRGFACIPKIQQILQSHLLGTNKVVWSKTRNLEYGLRADTVNFALSSYPRYQTLQACQCQTSILPHEPEPSRAFALTQFAI
jgi:hypothetical protein